MHSYTITFKYYNNDWLTDLTSTVIVYGYISKQDSYIYRIV